MLFTFLCPYQFIDNFSSHKSVLFYLFTSVIHKSCNIIISSDYYSSTQELPMRVRITLVMYVVRKCRWHGILKYFRMSKARFFDYSILRMNFSLEM